MQACALQRHGVGRPVPTANIVRCCAASIIRLSFLASLCHYVVSAKPGMSCTCHQRAGAFVVVHCPATFSDNRVILRHSAACFERRAGQSLTDSRSLFNKIGRRVV